MRVSNLECAKWWVSKIRSIQTHFEEILSSVFCAQPANKCLLSHAYSQELHKCGRNTYSCFAQPRPPLYTCQYSCSPQILMVKNDFNNSAGFSQELHNWWPRYFRLFCPVLVWGKRNSNCAISSFLSEKSMSREKYMRTAEEDIKKTTHSFLLRGCRFLPSFICAISLRFASMHVLDIRLGTSMKFYIGPLPLFSEELIKISNQATWFINI